MRVRVEILDQNEDHIGDLNDYLLSGQIDVDATQIPTRSATLTLLDPKHRLKFDPTSPSEAAVFTHRMIRITRGIYAPSLQDWEDRPVFWGPITDHQRDGPTVTLTCKGKEILLVDPALMWKVQTFRKGHKITDVIRTILQAKGERRFDFSEHPRTTHKHLSVGRHEEPWAVCRNLANSINMQLFYDGRGRAKLRRVPENAIFTVRHKAGGTLLTHPQIQYSESDVRNLEEVLGPKPSHKKVSRIRAVAVAPPSNPLSPAALSRNGEPFFLVESTGINGPSPPTPLGKGHHDPKTITKFHKEEEKYHRLFVARSKYAQELADRLLRQRLKLTMTVDFDMLPVPDLEEMDPIVVIDDNLRLEFPLVRWTLPLTHDPMHVGTNRRVAQHRRRSHHHRGHHKHPRRGP